MTKLESAPWYGPLDKIGVYNASQMSTQGEINPLHTGQRYIQYRAMLRHDFTVTPILERVQITFQPGGKP